MEVVVVVLTEREKKELEQICLDEGLSLEECILALLYMVNSDECSEEAGVPEGIPSAQ